MRKIITIAILSSIFVSNALAYDYGDGKHIDDKTRQIVDVAVQNVSESKASVIQGKVDILLKRKNLSKKNRELLEYIGYTLQMKGISTNPEQATTTPANNRNVVASQWTGNYDYKKIRTIDELRQYIGDYERLDDNSKTNTTEFLGLPWGDMRKIITLPENSTFKIPYSIADNINWQWLNEPIDMSKNIVMSFGYGDQAYYILSTKWYVSRLGNYNPSRILAKWSNAPTNITTVSNGQFDYTTIKTVDELKRYVKEYIEIEPSLKYTDNTGNIYSVGFLWGYVNISNPNNIDWNVWAKNILVDKNVLLMTRQNGKETYMLTVGGYTKTLVAVGRPNTSNQTVSQTSTTSSTTSTTGGQSQTTYTPTITSISLSELKTKASKSIDLHGVGGALWSPTKFPDGIKWIYRDATDMNFWNGIGIKDNPNIPKATTDATGIDINSPFYLFEARTDGTDIGTNKSWTQRMIGIVNVSDMIDLDSTKNSANIYVLDDQLQNRLQFISSNSDVQKVQDPFIEKVYGTTWKNLLITARKSDGTNAKNGVLNIGDNIIFELQSTNRNEVMNTAPIMVWKQLGNRISNSLVLEQTGKYGNIYYRRFYLTDKFSINTQAIKTIADINALWSQFDSIRGSFSKTFWWMDPLNYYQEFVDGNGNLDTKKIEAYKSLQILVGNLTAGMTDDDKKIEGIFNWIVGNIKYNEAVDRLLTTVKTEDEFNEGIKNISNKNVWSGIYTYINKDGVCAGYANLFSIMLTMAWINDQEVKAGLVNGGPIWKSSHVWNRVGSYYYDPTWGKNWYKLTKDTMYQNRKDFSDMRK